MLLTVTNLTVIYDRAMIINGLSFTVNEGELVSLVGPNGAGKSTLLRAITGLVNWEKEALRKTTGGDVTLKGEVVFNGERIENMPAHEIVKKGLVHCPERRRPFREMTVLENLMAGAYLVTDKAEVGTQHRPEEGQAPQAMAATEVRDAAIVDLDAERHAHCSPGAL